MEKPRALKIEKQRGKEISRLSLRQLYYTVNKSGLVNEMFIIGTSRASADSTFLMKPNFSINFSMLHFCCLVAGLFDPNF